MITNAQWLEVTYEQDGHVYRGYYRNQGGTMTVTYEDDGGAEHGKSSQLMPGGLSQQRLAQSLLGELIRELELGVPA